METHSIKIIQTLSNNFYGLLQVLLRNHERRGETHAINHALAHYIQKKGTKGSVHVHVRRLRQHTPALQQQAELPRRPALLALRLINDNRVQQTTPTDGGDEGRVEGGDGGTEELAELHGTLRKLFVDEDVKGCHGDGAAERVAGSYGK
jgi:hypothetical protein